MKRVIWQTPKAGNIADLSMQEVQLPALADDCIRIRVKAVGLNFADIFALTGLYSATPKGAFIPGLEFSGEILAIGKSVAQSAPALSMGQRVIGLTRFGAYASVVDIRPDYCFPLPDQWSFEQGAAFPVQTLTAWYGLDRLGAAKPDHQVLVQSAAGGVGLQALALCRQFGMHPVSVVGNQEKADFLKQKGFSPVLVRGHHFLDQLDAVIRDTGIDLILDGVGGRIQKQLYQRLNPMGRLVVFGAAEFTPGKKRPNYLSAAWRYLRRPRYDVLNMISDNRSVMAFNLIWLWDQVEQMRDLMGELIELPLPAPYIGGTFAFEEAHSAIQYLRSGQSMGKVVLTID